VLTVLSAMFHGVFFILHENNRIRFTLLQIVATIVIILKIRERGFSSICRVDISVKTSRDIRRNR